MEKFGILLLGHGSSLPYNKELVEETANMLRKKHLRAREALEVIK